MTILLQTISLGSMDACLAALVDERIPEAEGLCREVVDEPVAWYGVGISILFQEFTLEQRQQIMLFGVDHLSPQEKTRLSDALDWLHRAANAGNSDAQLHYGLMHGVFHLNQSPEVRHHVHNKSTDWLKKSAAQDNLVANVALGRRAIVEFRGLTIIEDESYLPYLKRATKLGDKNSAQLLRELEVGLNQLARLEQHAASNNVDSLRELGEYKLHMGEEEVAYAYLKRAADLGDLAAIKRMAEYYLRKEDSKEMYRDYLEKAVAQGDAEAMLRLGDESRDLGEMQSAERLYCRAHQLGHEEAQYALAERDIPPDRCSQRSN